jgi:hypothetical protein
MPLYTICYKLPINETNSSILIQDRFLSELEFFFESKNSILSAAIPYPKRRVPCVCFFP